MTALAPHLPETERQTALRDALAAASAISSEISSDSSRARALTALAPHLPETLLRNALAAVSAISDEWVRARALTLLAPHLPETERQTALRDALAAASAISVDWVRARALTLLAPHLPETLLRDAISAEFASTHASKGLAQLLPNATPKPQFFVTRIIGSEDQPDVEILTLPAYPYPAAISNFEQLEREVLLGEEFPTIAGSSIDSGPDACLTALNQLIINAGVREGLFWKPESYEAYARDIFSSQAVPVMNSPVSGSTLLQMVTAAGGGAAFMAAFPNPDASHITIYFLMIGGTRIVLGAADGVSIALKQGVSKSS